MLAMIKKLFNRFRAPAQEQPADSAAVDMLSSQSQIQSLRMEREAGEQRIKQLSQEIERLRERQDQMIAETAAARLEALYGELAGPASQVLTQADLLENQGKPVQARDVLAVARRMLRALERHGLVFDGQAGAQVAFDPSRHTPMNNGPVLQPGQMVTMRFAGVLYGGKILYKAVVE
jgi:molecular chaperone GrpE (heat shock protein)